MNFQQAGGVLALGAGTTVAPVFGIVGAAGPVLSLAGKAEGVIKDLAGKLDFAHLFGQTAHEKEHIATISALYNRAVQGDASAYAELNDRMTAKWPGDPNKWLRPKDERDLAQKALNSLATNTQFITTVATNPLYAELRKVSQDIRDDLATAVGRVGAGMTQNAVDAVGGPNGKATGGAVLPLSHSQLLTIAIVGGVLLVIALKKRGA